MIRTGQLAAVLLLLAAGAVTQSRPSAECPNLLLVVADDWGWPHAGICGDPAARTPAFDAIARDGVLFTHAFAAVPSCSASRAAVLTGRHPWRLGPACNLYGPLPADVPVFVDRLEHAGYFVGHAGKGWGPGRLGGRPRNPAGPRYDDFRSFLEKRPAARPFCFWYGSRHPHRPYEPGSGRRRGIDPARVRVPACLPDVAAVRSDLADHLAAVARFDGELGDLLEVLEEHGAAERTVVLVTSDHGMPFPRCKANLYDRGCRVPLAVRWPGHVAGGRRVDDLVSLVDLTPTLLDLAGVAPGPDLDGRSLVPLLESGESGVLEPDRDAVLLCKERHVPCQEAPDRGGTPMRGLRTRRFLLVRNLRPGRWPAGTPHHEKAWFPGSWYGDVDNGPTKSWMVAQRGRDATHRRLFELAFARRPAVELYDLGKDPDQLVNVAGDARYAAARERLSARLERTLRASGDPRVTGGGDVFDRQPYTGGSPTWPGGR